MLPSAGNLCRLGTIVFALGVLAESAAAAAGSEGMVLTLAGKSQVTIVTDNAKGAAHVRELEIYAAPPESPSKAKPATASPRAETAGQAAESAAAAVREKFHAHLRSRAHALPEKQISDGFPASRDEWLRHSHEVRRRLCEVFDFPKEDAPLDARTVGRLDRGDFVIEKVIYQAEAGNRVTANVYVPKDCRGRVPALVCPSGHGGSKSAPYNQYFGQMYAKAGCVVLVPDTLGEEERDEKGRLAIRGHRLEHRIDRCIELGTCAIGKMVYDIRRGVDYLVAREEVDPQRIGCVGHSLGGTLAEFATAVDPRIRLSMPTAWTCNFAEIIGELSCCWRPVGLLPVANNPELFALGAPHCATLVLAGGDDATPMHVDLFKTATIAKAKKGYELFGRGDCLAVHVTQHAGHQPFQLNRVALGWVEKHLDLPKLTAEDIERLDESPSREMLLAELPKPFTGSGWAVDRLFAAGAPGAGVRLLPFEMLRCLAAGEEAGPEFGMAGWMAARERALAAPFAPPSSPEALKTRRETLRKQLRALLKLPQAGEAAEVQVVRKFRTESAEAHELRYGLLGLSSILMLPNEVDYPPVAILLDQSRTKEAAVANPRTQELLAGGIAVLALDCVPFEETTFLLDTSPTAYNVGHVLESVDVLTRAYNVAPKTISLVGEVDDVAAIAALLDERIAGVVVASTAGARVPRQAYRAEGIVPGLRAMTTRTEILAMLAPRPLRIETPVDGEAAIAAVYRLAGAENKLEFAVKKKGP